MLNKYIFLFLLTILTGCTAVPSGNFEEGSAHIPGKQFVVWMLSDIQPPTPAQRITFERAVADVNEGVGPVDMGIMAGDLLTSRSKDEDFRWFIQTRGKSKITDWYQIAGNHDVRSGEVFYKYFPQPEYYAVEMGNLLFLFLSDQSVDSRTDLSSDAFLWWKEMVEQNQDMIIVTVTHAQLKGSGLLSSSLSSRVIFDSERFEKVLKQQRVALWVSGHSHLPHGFSGTVTMRQKLGGTCFVNVSSISDESFLDSESRFFYFHEGSDQAWMRSRNHSKHEFNSSLDIPISLGKVFAWNGEKSNIL
ncbi:metallophosphoesterase family protein [Desulforhopalus sp. 52FAK]